MNYRKTILFLGTVVILLITLGPCAVADEEIIPPPPLPDIDTLGTNKTSSPVTSVLLGKLRVQLEHSTMREVQKIAGGRIHYRGEAGTAESWVCYRIPNSGQPAHIWFSSVAELGGPEQVIDNFYADVSDPAVESSPSCPELPTRLRPVSLANSLWLGSKVDQLNELAGKVFSSIDGWRFYSYSHKNAVEGSERLAILGVRIRNARIISLYEAQITAY